MEYYLDSARVHGEVGKLRVAVSYLDRERMDFTIGVGDTQRPQTWTEHKEVICAHVARSPRGKPEENEAAIYGAGLYSIRQPQSVRTYQKKRRRMRLLRACSRT